MVTMALCCRENFVEVSSILLSDRVVLIVDPLLQQRLWTLQYSRVVSIVDSLFDSETDNRGTTLSKTIRNLETRRNNICCGRFCEGLCTSYEVDAKACTRP